MHSLFVSKALTRSYLARSGFWHKQLVHTAISKNVVGENDECQLSNGDCTAEKKCGYWILIGNKLPWCLLHTLPTFDGESYHDMVCHVKPGPVGSLSKHDVDESENVIWKCRLSFCNHLSVIQSHYAWKMRFNYPGIKFEPALATRQNWTFVIICSRRPHNCKKGHFTS